MKVTIKCYFLLPIELPKRVAESHSLRNGLRCKKMRFTFQLPSSKCFIGILISTLSPSSTSGRKCRNPATVAGHGEHDGVPSFERSPLSSTERAQRQVPRLAGGQQVQAVRGRLQQVQSAVPSHPEDLPGLRESRRCRRRRENVEGSFRQGGENYLEPIRYIAQHILIEI